MAKVNTKWSIPSKTVDLSSGLERKLTFIVLHRPQAGSQLNLCPLTYIPQYHCTCRFMPTCVKYWGPGLHWGPGLLWRASFGHAIQMLSWYVRVLWYLQDQRLHIPYTIMWPAFLQTPHAHYCDDPQGYEESLYRKPHVPAGRFAKASLLLLKSRFAKASLLLLKV